MLADILGMFSDKTSLDYPYLNAEKFSEMSKKYGFGVVALILNLLQHADKLEHYGNLTCSSALTWQGVELVKEIEALMGENEAPR